MIITQYLLFCGSHDHYIVSIELQFVVPASPQPPQPPQPSPQSQPPTLPAPPPAPPPPAPPPEEGAYLHEVGATGAGAGEYEFYRVQYKIYREHYIVR